MYDLMCSCQGHTTGKGGVKRGNFNWAFGLAHNEPMARKRVIVASLLTEKSTIRIVQWYDGAPGSKEGMG